MNRNVSRLLRSVSAAAAAGLLTAGVASLQAQSPPKTEPKDAAKEAAKDTRDAAKDKAQDARETAKDARDAARDQTQNARDAVKDRAPDAKDARDTAKDARDNARDATRDARDTTREARDSGRDAGRDARDRVNENRPTPRDPSLDLRDRDNRDRDARSDDRRDSRHADFRVDTFRSADMGLWFTSTNNNLVISDIASTGPIARLGFRADDRIVSVNGQRVTTEREFIRYLYAEDVRNERVKVIVLRDGREEVIFVEPAVFVESYSTVETDPLEEFGVILDDRVTDQLVVWRVIPRTPAYYAGIRAGDVLTTYDGQTISGTQQLVSLVQRGGRDVVRVGVTRNKAPRTLDVEFTHTSQNPAERREDRQDRREERRDDRQDRRDGDRTGDERQRALKVEVNTPGTAPSPTPAPVTPPAVAPATPPTVTPPANPPRREEPRRPGILPRNR